MINSPINGSAQRPAFTCSRLTADHTTDYFDCGHESGLNSWLRTKARAYEEENLCAVWVLSPEENLDSVAGFFTLSAHEVSRQTATKRDRNNNKNNGTIVGSLPAHPAQLLGKFAVDMKYQGCGLGKLLMLHVYEKYMSACRYSASKYLVVDAQHKKIADYYGNTFGFVESIYETTANNSTRLYRLTADIADDVHKAYELGLLKQTP